MNDALLIAALTVGVPALTATLTLWAQRRKQEASAESTVTTSALSVLEQWRLRAIYLEDQVIRLEKEQLELERKLREYNTLKYGARRLAAQVESLGHKPVYKPPADTGDLNGGK